MGMTDAQAMDLMTKDAFQTQAEADGKLIRAKISSTQLPTYQVASRMARFSKAISGGRRQEF